MGVTWLFFIFAGCDNRICSSRVPTFRVFEYPVAAAALSSLHSRVVQHLKKQGAQLVGQFSVDATIFTPAHEGLQHSINLCHHSNFPESSFTISQPMMPSSDGQQQELICAVSDRNFDKILNKMSDVLKPKLQASVDCKGTKLMFGSGFVLNVGAASVATNFKAVVIEIEYQPCPVPALCHELMREFVESVVLPPAASAQFSLPSHINELIRRKSVAEYSPLDTMIQYLELFTQLRKTEQASSAAVMSS